MVNDSKQQGELPLEQVLKETKQELLRTQVRLHQLQETAVAEGALLQLRRQYLQSQYELWVMRACMAWMKGELLSVTQCLEASLECVSLESQAVVADWLRRLDQFSREMQPVIGERSSLTLASLLATSEWKALMEQVVEGP